ncbi:N-formylglutamate amidohydrolase [uncultured Desulfosarcina sp.]|uniref:N-formylglutamate amidohydrolase n=1 Tax=uncultured Desulfosarcina sp. TaxID=218289 RepID=UPI0029C8F99E|nr:N-formylglutamate amidohydrolase [uncultured Desulfosarcina sp.]
MIFHIPHASFDIPVDLRSTLLIDDQALMEELSVMTDAHVDDLFGCHAGEEDTIVAFQASRLIVDPERFTDDALEIMAWVGLGVIYEQTSSGDRLRNTPSLEDRDELIRRFYVPHHKRLNEATAEALGRYGSALILDCHSFPSTPLPFEFDQNPDRPDICIGTDPAHTPRFLIEAAKQAASDEGLTCRINKPSDGSLVPTHYWQHDKRVLSIMIEINRSLFMDEATGERSDQYEGCKTMLGRIVQRIREASIPDQRT